MPKLSTKHQKKAEAAEEYSEREYEPLPPGKYTAVLEDVEVREGRESGNEYWSAEFRDIEDLDGEEQSGRLWYRLMLPIDKMPKDYRPKSRQKKGETEEEWIARSWKAYQDITAGRIKSFFSAFGFSLDSDTEELQGERVGIVVGITTMQQGPRKGQQTNEITSVFALDGSEGSSSEDDDDF